MKKTKMQVLPLAEVKKGISLDEWVKLLFTWVVNTVCDHYGEGMIAPAEISFSQDVLLYESDYNSGDLYSTRVNDKGIMQATYFGDNHEKSGRIYLQHFKNAFSGIYEIEDDDEFSKAQDIFKVTTTDPGYLIEAHKYLKETIPGAELFMFAYTETTLRVVDLNQDPSFKRELKKKGLI